MKPIETIKVFEEKHVRTLWDDEQERWYVSIIDVIEILAGTDRPRKYWGDLKKKLKIEGSELSEKIGQLKMRATDGKMRLTDVADTEQLFRLIQSIPSPKAEPFKLWLAQLASERLDEMSDPEQSIDRALKQYLALGYSENWINQRLKSIEIRKELTDEWKRLGIKEGQAFATLTNIITQTWARKTTKDISEAVNPQDFEESKQVARQGGNAAKVAREELETKTGKKVVTSNNATHLLDRKTNE